MTDRPASASEVLSRDAAVGDLGTLPVDKLEPCPGQGPTKMERVDWLVANWIPDAMGPLRVYRRDGRWYIRNGRHRWLAAQRLGLTELRCVMTPGPARPWRDLEHLRFWVDGKDPHPDSGYGLLAAMEGLAPKYKDYPRILEGDG